MQASIELNRTPAVHYLLRIGDTCLVLAQRLGEWCGHAPVLEEDIAMANIALDLVGQARAVLTHAGQLEGADRAHDEDQLA
jgi:ring-1,2-phenylacetyl-CoA epoxidase subunit PaaC